MLNIEKILNEKSVLNKVSKKVYKICFFTHNELKVMSLLSICFMAFAVLFTDYFFENAHNFLGFFSSISGVIGFCLGVLIVSAFLSNDSKIVKNAPIFYKSFLTDEEFEVFENALSNEEMKNMDNIERVLEDKLNRVNEKFMEEDVLKEFHAYLLENKKAFDEHILFFKECLSEFNKTHNWRANEVEKINVELKAAGLRNFEVEDKTLKITIEENEA